MSLLAYRGAEDAQIVVYRQRVSPPGWALKSKMSVLHWPCLGGGIPLPERGERGVVSTHISATRPRRPLLLQRRTVSRHGVHAGSRSHNNSRHAVEVLC